jgi:hypothetical protein
MPKIDFNDIGYTGLNRSAGYIHEEFLHDIQGQRGVRLYKEMRDNSSVVGAIFYTIKNLARNVDWDVVPKRGEESNPEAVKNAEFIKGALHDMSHTFDDLISEIFSMLPFGWSYFEEVYKIRDGNSKDENRKSQFTDKKIGWKKIPIRSQESLLRWEFSESGDIKGMWQMGPPNYQTVFLPIEKCLLFRTDIHKNNPEGRSILRNAVVDYHYMKRISETEAIGISRDMTGLITMEVPQEILSASPNSKFSSVRNELERMLSAIHRDQREFAMIPQELDREGKPTGFKLKLLASSGRRQIDTNAIILRYGKQIAMSMLAEFIYLGLDKVGSFALASIKTNMFSMAIGAMLDSISSNFERHSFPRLLNINGMDDSLTPRLVHGDLITPPLDEIATYLNKLAGAELITSSEDLEEKLLDLANMPKSGVKSKDKPLDDLKSDDGSDDNKTKKTEV